MLVRIYKLRGVCVRRLLSWSGLQVRSFYYKRSLSRKGIKPSTKSVNCDGELVENAIVIKDIEGTLAQEFCCYGLSAYDRRTERKRLDHQSQKSLQAYEGSKAALWSTDKNGTVQTEFCYVQESHTRTSLTIPGNGYQVRSCTWSGQKRPALNFHAQMVIDHYYKWYNEKRKNWSLNRQTSETAWKKYNPIPFENEKRLNYL